MHRSSKEMLNNVIAHFMFLRVFNQEYTVVTLLCFLEDHGHQEYLNLNNLIMYTSGFNKNKYVSNTRITNKQMKRA